MSQGFRVEGVAEVRANLNRLFRGIPKKAGAALRQEAEAVMTKSKRDFVPVDLGTLRSSGHVEDPEITRGGVRVRLVYGGPAAPYALKVHENPRAGKTQGRSPKGKKYYPKPGWGGRGYSVVGQWKYLEQPLLEAVPGLPARLARRMQLTEADLK